MRREGFTETTCGNKLYPTLYNDTIEVPDGWRLHFGLFLARFEGYNTYTHVLPPQIANVIHSLLTFCTTLPSTSPSAHAFSHLHIPGPGELMLTLGLIKLLKVGVLLR